MKVYDPKKCMPVYYGEKGWSALRYRKPIKLEYVTSGLWISVWETSDGMYMVTCSDKNSNHTPATFIELKTAVIMLQNISCYYRGILGD